MVGWLEHSGGIILLPRKWSTLLDFGTRAPRIFVCVCTSNYYICPHHQSNAFKAITLVIEWAWMMIGEIGSVQRRTGRRDLEEKWGNMEVVVFLEYSWCSGAHLMCPSPEFSGRISCTTAWSGRRTPGEHKLFCSTESHQVKFWGLFFIGGKEGDWLEDYF